MSWQPKKFLSFFFNRWGLPLALYGVALELLLVAAFWGADLFCFKEELVSLFCIINYGLALLVVLSSIIYNIIKRRWVKSILTFFSAVGANTIFILFFLMWARLIQVFDIDLANNNIVPVYMNIKAKEPIALTLNQNYDDSLRSIPRKYYPQLQLYSLPQRGFYEYDFWYANINKGVVYLRIYELYNNGAITPEQVKQSTAVEIGNSSYMITRFGTDRPFKIAQGHDIPYKARVEIWFAADSGGKEQKLHDEFFWIDGVQKDNKK